MQVKTRREECIQHKGRGGRGCDYFPSNRASIGLCKMRIQSTSAMTLDLDRLETQYDRRKGLERELDGPTS
jgi:hypothetical protein